VVLVSEKPPIQGRVATDNDMPWVLGMLDQAEDLAVDTETSGLRVRDGRDYLMGFCFDVPGLGVYIPFRHETDNVGDRWLQPLYDIMKVKDLIWHHRKFDMHSIRTIGMDPLKFSGKQYCTMVAARLLDNELYSYELDSIAKLWLPGLHKWQKDEIKGLGQAIGFSKITPKMYEQYGPIDAHITRRLRDYIWPKLQQRELTSVYWDTEEPFTALLYAMEQRGVGVNAPFCTDNAERGNLRMATIQRQLGYNPASPLDLKRVLLNELNLPVLKHTKSCEKCTKRKWPVDTHEGPPSFDKSAMEEYDIILSLLDNPTAKLITEFRGWQKAVTSLYEPMLTKVSPDGRIRPNFKQHGTKTGRLSCEDPNLQQVPRSSPKAWNGHAKSAFNSGREGYLLYGWDYSQIELRLAAAYGQEHLLLTEFESESADPFSVLAPRIFPNYTEELHEEFRHKTKNGLVYPSLYGAGLPTVAASLGISEADAKPILDQFRKTISGITGVAYQANAVAETQGFVKYWDGRRRNFRNKAESHKAWNSVLQGGAAQLLKKAMLRCRELETDDCYMVLTVHDEITFVVREDKIKEYEPYILHAMVDDWDFGVKLAAAGKEWK
jgi:DNA polymerase-1